MGLPIDEFLLNHLPSDYMFFSIPCCLCSPFHPGAGSPGPTAEERAEEREGCQVSRPVLVR